MSNQHSFSKREMVFDNALDTIFSNQIKNRPETFTSYRIYENIPTYGGKKTFDLIEVKWDDTDNLEIEGLIMTYDSYELCLKKLEQLLFL